jgi:Ca-activated chloride channel family protein
VNVTPRLGLIAEEYGTSPILQSVHAAGRIDGLLLDLTVRQTYRNTTRQALEVAYTFPLPLEAVLLGLVVELAGKRMSGVVLAKAEAETNYETAMAEGDTPIMLERCGDGLYTANLGNLKPGEEAVLEYRYGQLLSVDQDQVRVCIPTTIAPRYGDPAKQMQGHQVPVSSLVAQYPLSLTLDIHGDWARGEIGCATHACRLQVTASGVQFALGANAWLDRDVVVTLKPATSASRAQCVRDGDAHVVLASLIPDLPASDSRPTSLKLLLDCSGSMAGDSIGTARSALLHVARSLQAHDRFSFTRFGTEVRHGFQRLAPARPANVKLVEAMIQASDADMGGTEMPAALHSTVSLRGTDAAADILLITDGEIWDAESMIETARRSGHRIFAVGVGSAPAESLLRRLAEATGGACEFATPGEDLRAVMDRMMARVRQVPCGALRWEWIGHDGAAIEPAWVGSMPNAVFAGSSTHVFAGFTGAVPAKVRLMAGEPHTARGLAHATVTTLQEKVATLPRIAASARLMTATHSEALELALAYQLVTRLTHLFLVHQRSSEDRVTEFAHLHRVSSMTAAGWGGTGSARAAALGTGILRACSDSAMVSMTDIKFSVTDIDETSYQPIAQERTSTLPSLLHSLPSDGRDALTDTLDPLQIDAAFALCVDDLRSLGLTADASVAMTLQWLAAVHGIELSSAIEQWLDHELMRIDETRWQEGVQTIERRLGQRESAAATMII